MLTISNLTKSFGPTRAVDDVSLSINAGEIVGIVGENGAGKTTLMRIIGGELAADGGTVAMDGQAVLVHQHFMLVGDFTIAENLALALPEPPWRLRTPAAVERRAVDTISATGIALPDVRRRADELSVGEKAKLELVKAIARRPQLLILDEPTSVLTPIETAELFSVVRRLAAGGTAVAFISHKLREVLEVASRIVVMRRGKVILESDASRMTAADLATAMVAAPQLGQVNDSRGPANRDRHAVIRLRGISGRRLQDVSLEVGRGEIVAIAGVAGNGQEELAAIVAGLERPASGSLEIDATRVGLIPEDRTRDGLVGGMSIAENLALLAPRWRRREVEQRAERLIALYSIRALSASQRANSLSGGNQQKLVLARELDARPDAIVAAEPTRGLDFDAARFVHDQLRAAAARGAAVLLITSDLDEAFALADAFHVIYRGSLSPRLTPAEAESRVAALMSGVA